jgi:preprotein translocase SecE subunit
MGSFFAVLALTTLIAGIVAVGFHPRAVDFLIEVEQEMVKVEWPTRSTLVRSTIIIFIATALLAALIFLVDLVNYQVVLKWLPSLFHQVLGA